MFSICIPVYNTAKYLDQCLQSILCQTMVDYEIILLDDGSTDSSGAICDRYAALYPNVIRVVHKENEGLLMTRRRGFLEAKGDWFLCVDSDDYIKEGHLQAIADAIEKYDCDMVLFDYESVYPDGHTEPSGIDIASPQIYEGTAKQDIYRKRLLKNKYNNMWSKAIKRSVLDFDTDYRRFGIKNMCEDALQSYELYTRAQKIVFIPQALYAYRRNIASISANISVDYWNSLRICYELGWEYLTAWQVSADTRSAYGARCLAFYCDFLSWLVTKSPLDESSRIELFDAYLLHNPMLFLAAACYEKKYFATTYLKFRNPSLLKRIRSRHPWQSVCKFLRLERKLLGALRS